MNHRLLLIPFFSCAVVMAIAACALPNSNARTADGDPVLGKTQFAPCTACHTVGAGEPNKVGPNLHGVVGRMAGSRPDFSYSDAMRTSGVIWDSESLDALIEKPFAFIPGNKMAFFGEPKEDVRANIIAYLKESTKKEN